MPFLRDCACLLQHSAPPDRRHPTRCVASCCNKSDAQRRQAQHIQTATNQPHTYKYGGKILKYVVTSVNNKILIKQYSWFAFCDCKDCARMSQRNLLPLEWQGAVGRARVERGG